MTDILIIGGGPAGLTAALYAVRAGKTVQVFEKASPGGQILYSPLVENYPGFAHISGAELADRLQQQLEAQGVHPILEEVQALLQGGDGFLVLTQTGSYEARSVILATGVSHRRLDLEGEEELVGAGVSYCAVCDGPFYADRDVAVIGGGDTALQDAIFLASLCRSVTLIHRRDSFRAQAGLVAKARTTPNIRILTEREPLSYRVSDGVLNGLRLRDKKIGRDQYLSVEGVFLAVGQRPENSLAEGFTPLDEAGYIAASESCLTQTPGLFCAGDCRSKSLRQLTTAVSDGACAAIAACSYLDRP